MDYKGAGLTSDAPVLLPADPTLALQAATKQYVDGRLKTYSQTIGDGASTTITVTHNLNTADVDVSVFELTGNLRKVDSGVEIRSVSTTQIRLMFITAPASNSLRVNVFSSGGSSSYGTDVYSTSETTTNKVWIDGKTVYRKVINIGALPNATTKNTAHGITGITSVISVALAITDGSSFIASAYAGNGVGDFSIYVNGTNVIVITYVNRSTYSGYVIMEYTK